MALGVFLVPWGILRYQRTQDTGSLVLGVSGGVVAAALGIYFRYVTKRYPR